MTRRYSPRKAIDTEKDPYLLKEEPEDMTMCSECNIIYRNKRWRLPEQEELERKEGFKKGLCPACQKIRDRFVGGYVTLRGDFLREHKEEILNLLRNKEEIARHTNPLERIIEIRDLGDTVEISTTTEKFAQRIGRILHKAFHGEVEYKWSDDVKIARVLWRR